MYLYGFPNFTLLWTSTTLSWIMSIVYGERPLQLYSSVPLNDFQKFLLWCCHMDFSFDIKDHVILYKDLLLNSHFYKIYFNDLNLCTAPNFFLNVTRPRQNLPLIIHFKKFKKVNSSLFQTIILFTTNFKHFFEKTAESILNVTNVLSVITATPKVL